MTKHMHSPLLLLSGIQKKGKLNKRRRGRGDEVEKEREDSIGFEGYSLGLPREINEVFHSGE